MGHFQNPIDRERIYSSKQLSVVRLASLLKEMIGLILSLEEAESKESIKSLAA